MQRRAPMPEAEAPEPYDTRDPTAGLSPARHWGGFLAGGGIAFAVDAGMLEFGSRVLGLQPLVARPLAIATAMVAAWIVHRTVTFAVTTRPTVDELLRYMAAAWTTAAINYALFAAILVVRPSTTPFAALFAASVVATIFSYASMRYGVFRRS